MKKLIKVAVNDFRLVFRDNSLKIFLALPLLILVVTRYAVPYVAGVYPVVQSYISVIMMFASMQGSIAFGFIYSMVLVDEKDTNVAKVYGILPVSKFWFAVFRLIPPFVLAALATFLLLLVEPFYGLPLISNLIYSTLAGLVAPMMVLFIAMIAKNKIEAMTWQKLFNLPLFLPILAFFVPSSFSVLFAIFPTFWAYQGFSILIEGEGSRWLYFSIGFAYSLVLLVVMTKRFIRSHFK
jgi:fluoroquinolone transport system permease protein